MRFALLNDSNRQQNRQTGSLEGLPHHVNSNWTPSASKGSDSEIPKNDAADKQCSHLKHISIICQVEIEHSESVQSALARHCSRLCRTLESDWAAVVVKQQQPRGIIVELQSELYPTGCSYALPNSYAIPNPTPRIDVRI